MPEHIKWPSISQFRHVVSALQHKFQSTGERNEQGKMVLDAAIPLPVLKYKGTVKLHGNNASVTFNLKTAEVVTQGRDIILNEKNTNHGFFHKAAAHEELYRQLCLRLLSATASETKEFLAAQPSACLVLYGEWCGRGIHKKCAIHQLDPMFVVFRVGLAGELEDDDDASANRAFFWFNDDLVTATMDEQALADARIFSIGRFPTYVQTFDFNDPNAILQNVIATTLEVEKMCPVGQHFGVSGLGEGVVWRCEEPGYEHPRFWFKIKGDEHKNSKIKDDSVVDPEVAADIAKFVSNTVTESRLEQARAYLEARGVPFAVESRGEFLAWVSRDILREEADLIQAAGTDKKLLTRAINAAAKDWLKQQGA
jgi:hypothetical protein